jgi:hypothetical protein
MRKKIILLVGILFLTGGAIFAQANLKNASPNKWVEVSAGRDQQMLIEPNETKLVWFIPAGGEIDLQLRYFIGTKVFERFTYKAQIFKGQTFVLPEKYVKAGPVDKKNVKENKEPVVQKTLTPGFAPVIPAVSGDITVQKFPLELINATGCSLIIFEGDFYGAALAEGGKAGPIQTDAGIISLKILYDADSPDVSTGKNIWQAPVSGIVTQGQKEFVLKKEHLNNLQRGKTKVVFFNPTRYTMVCDDPNLDIDPIVPNDHSSKVRLNQGFNNTSFSYYNEQGVKVSAVFELVVAKRTSRVSLNLNPLGQAYGVENK